MDRLRSSFWPKAAMAIDTSCRLSVRFLCRDYDLFESGLGLDGADKCQHRRGTQQH